MLGDVVRAAFRSLAGLVGRLAGAPRARRLLREADALLAAGRPAEAARLCREAVSAAPRMGDAHNSLGVALMALGEGAAAERAFLAASEAVPACLEGQLNLAQRYLDTGRPGAARAQLRRAAEPAATHPRFSLLQGFCANAFGDAESALLHYRDAMRAEPADPDASGGYLMSLAYAESVTPQALLDAHAQWAAALPAPAPVPHARASRTGPLRIGYLSPDFRDHAVRYFFEPLLAHHDRSRFRVHCYSDVRAPDAFTQDIRSRADGWRDAAALSDAALAQAIREDGIDVLVDLAGHTTGNRLALLAQRPAPLQVTALGYPPTTGLAAIDYKLSDPVADPPGAERYYAEKLLRLEGVFWCFAPAPDAPPVAPPPCAARGHATFGCLGNLAKVTDGALGAWGAILRADRDARLLVMAPTLGDDAVLAYTRERMERAGIDLARADFAGRSDLGGFLRTYERVDAVLDTFPYNGGTTTCHALWMGVPVVTRGGEILLSRMGASMLGAVGLGDLVAADWDAYARIALGLARDRARLSALRASLRERMRRSPLCDGPRFVAGFEAALERSLG